MCGRLARLQVIFVKQPCAVELLHRGSSKKLISPGNGILPRCIITQTLYLFFFGAEAVKVSDNALESHPKTSMQYGVKGLKLQRDVVD